MLARFVADYPPETNLPSMDTLLYAGDTGKIRGGYSCVGSAPPTNGVPTQIVEVDVSAATYAAMKADPAYLFLEDVVDAQPF